MDEDDTPTNATVPESNSSEKYVTVGDLQKMEERLMKYIQAMIQPTLPMTYATPVDIPCLKRPRSTENIFTPPANATVDVLQHVQKEASSRLLTSSPKRKVVEAETSYLVQEDGPNSSPFCAKILNEPLPPYFREPWLGSYIGSSDPVYHIKQFELAISLGNFTEELQCHLLLTTLKGAALQWFSQLPVGSITSYVDFKKQLIIRFTFVKKWLCESQAILDVRQGPTESLREYINRFLQKSMDICDLDSTTAQLAFEAGLRDEPFRYHLIISPPKSFRELLYMASSHMDVNDDNLTLFSNCITHPWEEEKRCLHHDGSRKENGPFPNVEIDQSHTIFVKGFDRTLGLDVIQRTLEDHFGSCGEITRVSLPADYKSKRPKGFGFIKFNDNNSISMALQLHGSKLQGHTLTVEELKPRTSSRYGCTDR